MGPNAGCGERRVSVFSRCIAFRKLDSAASQFVSCGCKMPAFFGSWNPGAMGFVKNRRFMNTRKNNFTGAGTKFGKPSMDPFIVVARCCKTWPDDQLPNERNSLQDASRSTSAAISSSDSNRSVRRPATLAVSIVVIGLPGSHSLRVRRNALPIVRAERRQRQTLAAIYVAHRVVRPGIANRCWIGNLVAGNLDLVVAHEFRVGPNELPILAGDCKADRILSFKRVEATADVIDRQDNFIALLFH